MDDQMQQVLDLIEARSRGEVLNDAVERAVQAMLGKEMPKVTQDTDEYDDIQEEEEEPSTPASKYASMPPAAAAAAATLEDMMDADDDDDTGTPLDLIPMGHAASKMMITFGDGPSPHPAAVQAALLGCRRCLQMAIKDARAIRRSQKAAYATARQQVHRSSKDVIRKYGTPSPSAQSADPTMLYRAINGYDKLAYDPKCGFDVEQLRQLFPEEMTAYERWTDMHEATQEEDENGVTPDELEEDDKGQTEIAGGHLQERAAQFDARTQAMMEDWYMTFAEVRTGSFLPRRSQKKTQEEKTWDATRSNIRGRAKDGMWDNMTSATVRFLHWIGFDPRSALPPPSDETTQALAFLGYDMMGRIIETAIELRVRKRRTEGDGEKVLELNKDEQLNASDIEKALEDPSLKPVPLYSGTGEDEEDKGSILAGVQLYFGPGFEERLEMEMEEYVAVCIVILFKQGSDLAFRSPHLNYFLSH
jgi:hypothetical protein